MSMSKIELIREHELAEAIRLKDPVRLKGIAIQLQDYAAALEEDEEFNTEWNIRNEQKD